MEYAATAETVRELAREAAVVARDLQGKVEVRDKGGGQGPVTEADLLVERIVLEGLAKAFPEDAILSEETRQETDLEAPRIWCVDPIDGTREYSEGLDQYAVQIGLLAGGVPVVGVLALPGTGHLFWGWQNGGSRVEMDGTVSVLEPAAFQDLSRATAIHSRTHGTAALEDALAKLGVEKRMAAGGVGYKVGQVLLGHAHLYLHMGRGLKWWDSVGPAAVMMAAGGVVTDGSGAPVRYEDDTHHGNGMLFALPGLGPVAAARLADK